MIPTLFAKMVLRYHADILLSALPIVSVMDMLLSRIVLYFVVLATLNDLSYQERAMSAASVFPAIIFLGRVRIFFRPLDNNVVATFVSHYMITEYVLASELVQVATWLS